MAGRSAFGHIRQRTSGRWQARFQDATGRQHSSTHATKAEAGRWLRKQAEALDQGRWVDPQSGKQTFAAFAERWQATIVDLRASTLRRDLDYLERYLIPAFGKAELAKIDTLAVRGWLADMTASHSPATTIKAAQILGKIMRAAVDARLIASSPTDGLRLPKVERQEMRILEPGDVWRLADAVGDRWRGLILLGAYGGLRIGEMLALRVRSVDPLRRRVHVLEAVVEVAGRKHVGPPKTRAGRRTVPVPAFVVDALDLAGGPDALVFPNTRGGHVGLASWRSRVWRPAVASVGLDPLRIHDLRHTAVSLWIAAGATPLEVARRAGHSSVSVVFDVYGDLLPGAEDTLTARLEQLGQRPAEDVDTPLLSFPKTIRHT